MHGSRGRTSGKGENFKQQNSVYELGEWKWNQGPSTEGQTEVIWCWYNLGLLFTCSYCFSILCIMLLTFKGNSLMVYVLYM